jgi:uncharacterized SAM-binding protein YcdF (DUF218 family)
MLPIFLFGLWFTTPPSNDLRGKIADLIRAELIRVNPQLPINKVDAAYVLGGSQASLELKFKTASELYHKGISKHIMILSRTGKTEYSPLLRRNLTNNEWALLKLQQLGIPKENLELISVKEGFFGTLSEARAISSLIKERDYEKMVFISSPEHTRRVNISFQKFLDDHNLALFMQGSDESVSLVELLIELLKLKIYEYLLV